MIIELKQPKIKILAELIQTIVEEDMLDNHRKYDIMDLSSMYDIDLQMANILSILIDVEFERESDLPTGPILVCLGDAPFCPECGTPDAMKNFRSTFDRIRMVCCNCHHVVIDPDVRYIKTLKEANDLHLENKLFPLI